MPMATVTSKGQITLPKEIRDALGVSPGDRVEFVRDDTGRVLVRPIKTSILDLMGILKPRVKGVTIGQINETIRKRGAGLDG